MLEIDGNLLKQALITRIASTKNESITIPLKPAEAEDNRDALAKEIYERLFEWLVEHINHEIQKREEETRFIGALDIFGFECFKTNSFEQFCM